MSTTCLEEKATKKEAHHCRYFLGSEVLNFIFEIYLNQGFVVFARNNLKPHTYDQNRITLDQNEIWRWDFERPHLHVGLHDLVLKLTPDQAFSVKYRVRRKPSCEVFCCIADVSFIVTKRHIRLHRKMLFLQARKQKWTRKNSNRRRSVALFIGNYIYLPISPHSNTAISCPQVNTNREWFWSILFPTLFPTQRISHSTLECKNRWEAELGIWLCFTQIIKDKKQETKWYVSKNMQPLVKKVWNLSKTITCGVGWWC